MKITKSGYIGGDGAYKWDPDNDEGEHSGFYVSGGLKGNWPHGAKCCSCGSKTILLTYTNFHSDEHAPDVALCKTCIDEAFRQLGEQ